MAGNFWQCSHYLEWILDRQDVLKCRGPDLKKLGSEEEYQKIMIFFTDVIQTFGKSLEVRQQVIATASVYFRRFYSRTSLKSIDPWLMAPSCIFLASKVEEYGLIQPKSIIAACCKVGMNFSDNHLGKVNSQYPKFFKDYAYPYRTHDIFECEFILMEAMDCSLIVYHPYRPLLQFCEDLKPQMLEMSDELTLRAWGIANDSLRTDLCLHYPPYLIALGCVQMALISLARNPPASSSGGSYDHRHSQYYPSQTSINPLAVAEQWFAELNVDPERVLEVVRHLLALYDLLERMEKDNDLPTLILQRMPRPVIQQNPPPPPPPNQQPQQAASSQQAANQVQPGAHVRMGQPMAAPPQPPHLMPQPPNPHL